eukprot:scaffold14576_cov132-Isochrysis_galbana.AAC.8
MLERLLSKIRVISTYTGPTVDLLPSPAWQRRRDLHPDTHGWRCAHGHRAIIRCRSGVQPSAIAGHTWWQSPAMRE